MLRDVLFDVDGVLVHPWRFRSFLLREHGIDAAATRPFFTGPFRRCLVGEGDLYEEIAPFLEGWGWRGSVSSLIDLWFREENAPDPVVLEYVKELQGNGVRCHIASNQEQNRARFISEEMGFSERFDSLLFSSDLGATKPDPEFFKHAEQRLGRDTDQLVLVDDAAENIESARACGWEAILYTGPEDLTEVSGRCGLPTLDGRD